jgi:hypothetical protein
LTYALCTVCLHCFINDFERHVRDEDLGLRDFDESGFGVARVDSRGGIEHNEACGVDIDAGLGNPVQYYALF